MAANPNDNSFTNLFNQGMNQDSNLVMQPDGTYRYAKNFQLVSHDGNNYTIKDTLGNRKIFTIPKIYDYYNPSVIPPTPILAYQTEMMPIGFISFTDKLIVFSTNKNDATGGYGEIGILYLTNYGQSIEAEEKTITIGASTFTYYGYVPIYGHEDLNLSQMHKIEGFAYQENDAVNSVYWTDNYNQPRTINITDPIFTTYYTATNGVGDNPISLTAGVQYMVLGGIIEYPVGSGTYYGPGLALPQSNILTSNGVNDTYTVITGSPLVTEYYDVDLLNFTPSRALGQILFYDFGTGVKTCGNHMYFYQLENSISGYKTTWSYGSFPVHVGKDQDDPTSPTINSYHNYVGAGSTVSKVTSIKSVKLRITDIDTKYDKINLACAEFTNDYELIDNIKIVATSAINSSTLNTDGSITLEDFGNVDLGTLTLDDITLFPASVLKCKTMTTNKNYIVVGNITERVEFDDIDFSAATFSDFIYYMPVDVQIDYTSGGAPVSRMTNFCSFTPNVNPTDIFPKVKYVVTSVAGGNVTYNAVSYGLGDVFEGVSGVGAVTIPGASQVRPCFAWDKYVPIHGSAQRKTVIEAKPVLGGGATELNYRNPAAAMHLKSYRSGEKYRYGVLLFDKKGNPFYVRWLTDYTFSTISSKNGLLHDVGPGGVYSSIYSLTPNGFQIDNLRIPKEIVDQIDGFSIVRAECDPTIIGQGLLWQTCYESDSDAAGQYEFHPLPGYQLKAVDSTYSTGPYNGNYAYSWICPDYLVDFRGFKSPNLVAGNKLKVASWLNPRYFNGLAPHAWAAVAADESWSKLYEHVDENTTNEITITNIGGVNEGDTLVGFTTGIDFYNARMFFGNNGVSEGVDNTWYGGTTDWTNGLFVGGRKLAVASTTDLQNYNATAGYSSILAGNDTVLSKALVNYVVSKTNQYGGTGEDALAKTLYISTGHYQKIDSTVIADNWVGGTGVTDYTYLRFNGIQVFGGDTFVNMVDYGYGTFNSAYSGKVINGTHTGMGGGLAIFFPCENAVNYDLRRGRKVSDYGMQDDTYGVSYFGGGGSTGFESFAYNDAYSSDGIDFAYPALPVNGANAGRFPFRLRFAGQKFPGELLDSYRVFLVNDYKDVDGSLGEINNVRPKGDRVYYWQNKGVGSTPILERAIVSGTTGGVTSLGTGGVIDRFDTISPKFGNQHQHGLVEFERGWIWFDMRNKDVCVMSLEGGVASITAQEGMKSFFNQIFLERNSIYYSGTYLNSQTFDITSDRPLLGTGIVGVYDPKNKMTYLTFKFKEHTEKVLDPATAESYSDYQIVSKDFTIGYHHLIGKFVGFFDKTPAIWHNHNQSVLSANNPKNLNVYYWSGMLSTPVTTGDVIADGVSEYVATADGNVTYSTPPSGTYFTKINTVNEIYVENEMGYVAVDPAYLYNIFYGRVVNNELIISVNPAADWPFGIENQLMIGSGPNFTDFEYTDGENTATDANVKDWNRNYKKIDKGWFINMPFSKRGDLTGSYIQAKYTKRNWLTNPTVNETVVKIVQKIKSYFTLKF